MRACMISLAMTAFLLAGGGTAARAQSDLLNQGQDLLQGLSGGAGGGLQEAEVAAGLKEALKVGFERVVDRVGNVDGFNADTDIHIPLPGALKDVQKALGAVGMSSMADDLELRLNRAAEEAAPAATDSFFDAIGAMTLDDAERIYQGRDDEATRYFREKMTPDLVERFTPIVDQALSDVGAIQTYDDMMGEYDTLPFVPDAKADLSAYTVDKGMEGIFFYLAREEAAIRQNPAARTTELLQKVFGGN